MPNEFGGYYGGSAPDESASQDVDEGSSFLDSGDDDDFTDVPDDGGTDVDTGGGDTGGDQPTDDGGGGGGFTPGTGGDDTSFTQPDDDGGSTQPSGGGGGGTTQPSGGGSTQEPTTQPEPTPTQEEIGQAQAETGAVSDRPGPEPTPTPEPQPEPTTQSDPLPEIQGQGVGAQAAGLKRQVVRENAQVTDVSQVAVSRQGDQLQARLSPTGEQAISERVTQGTAFGMIGAASPRVFTEAGVEQQTGFGVEGGEVTQFPDAGDGQPAPNTNVTRTPEEQIERGLEEQTGVNLGRADINITQEGQNVTGRLSQEGEVTVARETAPFPNTPLEGLFETGAETRVKIERERQGAFGVVQEETPNVGVFTPEGEEPATIDTNITEQVSTGIEQGVSLGATFGAASSPEEAEELRETTQDRFSTEAVQGAPSPVTTQIAPGPGKLARGAAGITALAAGATAVNELEVPEDRNIGQAELTVPDQQIGEQSELEPSQPQTEEIQIQQELFGGELEAGGELQATELQVPTGEQNQPTTNGEPADDTVVPGEFPLSGRDYPADPSRTFVPGESGQAIAQSQQMAGQVGEQRGEQQPTIGREEIEEPFSEPEQPGPSIREQQRREGMFVPERQFPTGAGAVVGQEVGRQEQAERSEVRQEQELAQESESLQAQAQQPLTGVFGGLGQPGAQATQTDVMQTQALVQEQIPGLAQVQETAQIQETTQAQETANPVQYPTQTLTQPGFGTPGVPGVSATTTVPQPRLPDLDTQPPGEEDDDEFGLFGERTTQFINPLTGEPL